MENNNVNKLSANTSGHLPAAIEFRDSDTVELGIIDIGYFNLYATTFKLTESTNLTFGYDSLIEGAINQTATNSSSPTKINHNGGTLTMYSTTPYVFTGAFEYTAVSGTTTQISNTEVWIDTPNHAQTFGTLNMFFESFRVAAGSTVNFLDKGDFNLEGTSLEGSGTINGNVEFRNKGTLNPGTDTGTGTLTINGNLRLHKTSTSANNGANFAPHINSDIDYDSVDVFGTVELIDADFEPTGDFTITDVTQEILLINNDGDDEIIGTFNGLPEGASFGLGGFSGIISYAGGDGNDIVLITDTTDPIVSCQVTSFDLTYDTNEITISAIDLVDQSDDNVGIVTYLINGSSELSFDFHDVGEQIVTLSAIDAMGNTGTCEATIFINIVETEYFITQWETTSANELVIIETDGNPGYHYVVDWGDGTV